MFIISDPHLCDKGPRDNFKKNEKPFNDFLDFVGGRRLTILGDLFDAWQCNLGSIAAAYEPLLRRLADMGAYYVTGNHDMHLRGVSEITFGRWVGPDRPTIHPSAETLFFFDAVLIHGHQADDSCQGIGLGALTAILTGMAEDKNNSPDCSLGALEDTLLGGFEAAYRAYKKLKGDPSPFEKLKKIKGDAKWLISGHTHKAGYYSDWHVNAGTWARDLNTFVELTEAGPKLFKWEDGPVELDIQL